MSTKIDEKSDVVFVPLDEKLFVTQPELQCTICLHLMNDPVHTPCNHDFCRQCIQRSLTSKSSCPLCRAKLTVDKLTIVQMVVSQINRVHIKCPIQQKSGSSSSSSSSIACTWTGPHKDYTKHRLMCVNVQARCACGVLCTPSNAKKHLVVCALRSRKCKACKKWYVHTSYNKHRQNCDQMYVVCDGTTHGHALFSKDGNKKKHDKAFDDQETESGETKEEKHDDDGDGDSDSDDDDNDKDKEKNDKDDDDNVDTQEIKIVSDDKATTDSGDSDNDNSNNKLNKSHKRIFDDDDDDEEELHNKSRSKFSSISALRNKESDDDDSDDTDTARKKQETKDDDDDSDDDTIRQQKKPKPEFGDDLNEDSKEEKKSNARQTKREENSDDSDYYRLPIYPSSSSSSSSPSSSLSSSSNKKPAVPVPKCKSVAKTIATLKKKPTTTTTTTKTIEKKIGCGLLMRKYQLKTHLIFDCAETRIQCVMGCTEKYRRADTDMHNLTCQTKHVYWLMNECATLKSQLSDATRLLTKTKKKKRGLETSASSDIQNTRHQKRHATKLASSSLMSSSASPSSSMSSSSSFSSVSLMSSFLMSHNPLDTQKILFRVNKTHIEFLHETSKTWNSAPIKLPDTTSFISVATSLITHGELIYLLRGTLPSVNDNFFAINPVQGTCMPLPRISYPRVGAMLVVDAKNKLLYVMGGRLQSNRSSLRSITNTIHVFDIVANEWLSSSNVYYLIKPRANGCAVLLSDGRIWIGGGGGGNTGTSSGANTCEIYDPKHAKSTRVASIPQVFDKLCAALTLCGQYITVRNCDMLPSSSRYVYDIKADTWTTETVYISSVIFIKRTPTARFLYAEPSCFVEPYKGFVPTPPLSVDFLGFA